jgi:hypothetical protein
MGDGEKACGNWGGGWGLGAREKDGGRAGEKDGRG